MYDSWLFSRDMGYKLFRFLWDELSKNLRKFGPGIVGMVFVRALCCGCNIHYEAYIPQKRASGGSLIVWNRFQQNMCLETKSFRVFYSVWTYIVNEIAGNIPYPPKKPAVVQCYWRGKKTQKLSSYANIWK